jgi:hypothetical protein
MMQVTIPQTVEYDITTRDATKGAGAWFTKSSGLNLFCRFAENWFIVIKKINFENCKIRNLSFFRFSVWTTDFLCQNSFFESFSPGGHRRCLLFRAEAIDGNGLVAEGPGRRHCLARGCLQPCRRHPLTSSVADRRAGLTWSSASSTAGADLCDAHRILIPSREP